MPEHPNWVMFQLKRNDENRDAWSVLFGRKSFFFGTRQNDEIASAFRTDPGEPRIPKSCTWSTSLTGGRG